MAAETSIPLLTMNGFEAMMQNVPRVPRGTIEGVEHAAHFSKCRLYRYELWRKWSDTGYVMFIGLNPSTADEFTTANGDRLDPPVS